MFTPSFFIDTFQETKRTITNQIIKDPTLNKAAHDYINAQTAFAKMLVNNGIEVAKYSVESISKVLFPQPVEVTKAARAKAAKAESSAAQTDTDTQGE
jgi:hypothetical protein